MKFKMSGLMKYPKIIKHQNDELIFANVYHDTIKGIVWIDNNISISPGRYAVGYNYLYVMVRALNELHPHTILDLGLGISSTLISSYMSHFNYEDGVHDIVEENLDWIDFYRNRHKMSLNSEIFHKKVIERKNNDFNRSDHSRTDEWGGVEGVRRS